MTVNQLFKLLENGNLVNVDLKVKLGESFKDCGEGFEKNIKTWEISKSWFSNNIIEKIPTINLKENQMTIVLANQKEEEHEICVKEFVELLEEIAGGYKSSRLLIETQNKNTQSLDKIKNRKIIGIKSRGYYEVVLMIEE